MTDTNLVPVRRALMTADGRAGDAQTEAVELVTAGAVRSFGPTQHDTMIEWLAASRAIDADHLRRFLS